MLYINLLIGIKRLKRLTLLAVFSSPPLGTEAERRSRSDSAATMATVELCKWYVINNLAGTYWAVEPRVVLRALKA